MRVAESFRVDARIYLNASLPGGNAEDGVEEAEACHRRKRSQLTCMPPTKKRTERSPVDSCDLLRICCDL